MSKQSKHTPGPYERTDLAVYALEPEGRHERNRFFALVQPGPETPREEVEAVARLFVAAPELFEAAKHAAMEWRLHGQLTDSCRVLEAAIAKAEGR